MSNDINKIRNMATNSQKGEPTVPGDPPVYYTQVWLNQTYGYHPSWVPLTEDGVTGWGTIYSLIRALQIYLGVGADGDFGNGTRNAFTNRFASTGGELRPVTETVDNIYGIVTGALWCKGYYGSYFVQIDRKMDVRGLNSITSLKSDAGLNASNPNINALLMKSLLSMDQFVLLENYGGKAAVRSIQQYLNANFGEYVGIIPCDGLYQRDMNKALIKLLQYVEGFRGNDVDGIFGNGTKNNLPILSPSNAPADAVRLYNFCLTCNGYPVSGTNWTSSVTAKTKAFQSKHMIPQTGIADTNTWMALLLSKGNPDRPATGCDTATILDAAKATALYNAGYRYVGRYVSGTVGVGSNERSKALTKSEMNAIFNAGLRIFAIYQEGGVYLERYTYARGLEDAAKAINAAKALNIPLREYIYFAVDYDVMDGYVEPYVVQYFRGINEVMSNDGNRYHIGIYGARNVCSRICFEFGLASSSFVSDMSTAYSGNMGYQLPDNWAFDQYHEYTFSGNGVSFPLDKNAVSRQYLGFNQFGSGSDDGDPDEVSDEEKLDAAYDLMSKITSDINALPKLPPRSSFNWELGPFTVSVPPVSIAVSYKHSSLFNISEDNAKYGTFSITNGNIGGISWSSTQELFDSLDVDVKANIGFTDASFIFQLVQGIDNGRISTGTKFSTIGKLTFYVVIEQYLGKTESVQNTVSVKLEFSIDNDDDDSNDHLNKAYQESLEQIEKFFTIVSVGAAFAIVCSGGTAAVAAAVIVIFIGLASWLENLFNGGGGSI